MKNLFKIVGIIAITAVIGFSMTACPPPEPEEEELTGTITINPSGSVEIGTKLTATYSGTESVSFQWKKDNSNVGKSSTTNPNEYTPTEAGSYKVTVSAEGYKSKTSAAVTVTGGSTILHNAISLTEGEWTDGNLSSDTDQQWFTFVATDNTQNIFFLAGTLKVADSQIYENDATTENGTSPWLLGSITISQTATNNIKYVSGKRYYIKIFGLPTATANYPGITSGTFKIAFSNNTSPAIDLPTNATQLTANTWTAGDISSAFGEKWYKFTANATTQYIQFELGTMTMAFVQLYDATGKTVGDSATIMSTILNISRTVTSGSVYYVRVTALSAGTYKIGYTDSTTPPPITLPTENVTELTINTLSDGSIATAGGEQWFKFNATVTGAQYIHFRPGAVDDVNVQLYNSNSDGTGTAVGDVARLRDSTPFTSQTVTTGQDYYIKVTPYSSSKSGAYKIAFSASFMLGTATDLTEKEWADGNLESKTDEQWYKFRSSAATQYIHFKASDSYDNLYGVDIQLYDTNGTKVGDKASIAGYTRYATLTVTNNQEYYIKVTPYSSIGSDWDDGTYKIAFSSLSFPPDITQLTSDQWADGELASSRDEIWFNFTAGSANTHYIHFYPGTATYQYVQLFNADGTKVSLNKDDGTSSSDAITMGISTPYVSFTPANGNTYYIKVTSYNSYTGKYKIGYNTGKTPPPLDLTGIEATQLAADTFVNGNLANRSDEQWFKFTATATTQYIFFKAGTTGTSIPNVYVQLYDAGGRKVGDRTQLSAYSSPLSRTVTTGDCYINVTNGYDTGTYQIAYSSTFPPAGTVTDLSISATWTSGTLTSSGEQWFKYVPSADAALYFHLKGGTGTGVLTSAYTQIYEDAVSVGDSVLLNSRNPSPLTVKNGKTYYIKVTRSSSSSSTNTAYDIALTASPMPPDTTSTDITVGTWKDSTMPANSSAPQWFKFTATSDTQYIHLSPGGLTGADVQLYDVTTGAAVGETKYLSGSTLYVSRTVTTGKAYFIKVIPFMTTGTYKIGVTTSTTPPTTP